MLFPEPSQHPCGYIGCAMGGGELRYPIDLQGIFGYFRAQQKGKCYVESVAYGTGQDLIDRSSIFIQTGSDPYELHSLTAQRSASEDTP